MPSGVLCTCIALWLPEAWVPSQDAFQQPGEAEGRGECAGEAERGGTPGEVGKREREGQKIST